MTLAIAAAALRNDCSGITTLGTPHTPLDRRIRSEAAQVTGSRLLRNGTDPLTAARLRKNAPRWWRRGRRFVCPHGCAGGELVAYVTLLGASCACGRALIYAP